MSEAPLIEAKELVSSAGLDPVDFSIARGELLVIVGPEPKPLTRLLRVLAGLTSPHSGELRLLGWPVAGLDWRPLRRAVGFATPAAPLLSTLDGIRNLLLPVLYHRMGRESIMLSRARELIDEMELEGDPERLPAFMSELQRRHLVIARALMLAPRLLMIDEPLCGLHRDAADQLRRYLLGAVRRRTEGMVIAVDDPLLARAADRVLFSTGRSSKLFDSWQALEASGDNEVRRYLEMAGLSAGEVPV